MEELAKDIFTRNTDGFYQCKACTKKIFTKLIFARHLKNEHSPKFYVKEDKEPNNGTIDEQDFEVQISRNITSATSVKLEITSNISNKIDTPSNNLIKSHQCQDCNKSYDLFDTLQAHLKRVHKKRISHKCQECPKSFLVKCRLQKHINYVHKNLRHYKCTQCEKSFLANCELTRHISLVHEKLKPFQCTQCEKCFGRKVNLRLHTNNVHEKLKPFQCEQCSKHFAMKIQLQTHINGVHKKLKPFQCPECQMQFGQKQALNNHTARAHQSSPKDTFQEHEDKFEEELNLLLLCNGLNFSSLKAEGTFLNDVTHSGLGHECEIGGGEGAEKV